MRISFEICFFLRYIFFGISSFGEINAYHFFFRCCFSIFFFSTFLVYTSLVFSYHCFFIRIYAIQNAHHGQMRQQTGDMIGNNKNEVAAP